MSLVAPLRRRPATEARQQRGDVMDSIVMINKVLGETSRIVDGIEPDQLDNPTPCEGWTVRDVLNHITGGADLFARLDRPPGRLGGFGARRRAVLPRLLARRHRSRAGRPHPFGSTPGMHGP